MPELQKTDRPERPKERIKEVIETSEKISEITMTKNNRKRDNYCSFCSAFFALAFNPTLQTR